MPTKVSILVYADSVPDYPEYRHTSLFFEFSDGSTSAMHVKGTHGFYEFEEMTGYNPYNSRHLAKAIAVAELPDTISAASVSTVVSNTPVKNARHDADWNFQNWVSDALARLVGHGYLDAPQRDDAIDKMVDALLEAKDR